MLRIMLRGKIHRATVTDANVDYQGSITIDPELMAAAGMLPFEQVAVVDVDNGARLETYTIEAEPDSGVICLNGAAARLIHKGDRVIILCYGLATEAEARDYQPRLVFVDEHNRIVRQSNGAPALAERRLPCG